MAKPKTGNDLQFLSVHHNADTATQNGAGVISSGFKKHEPKAAAKAKFSINSWKPFLSKV
jgi:hypothetical protein